MDQAVLYEIILAGNYLNIKVLCQNRNPEQSAIASIMLIASCCCCLSCCWANSVDLLLLTQGLLDLCCKTVADIIKGRVSARTVTHLQVAAMRVFS